ncbi:MAG TPA: hypothetical protein VNS31_10495 [Ramlibacter sp.]|nr:hypothetical protein [Ramlibacter sp.]
MRESTITSGSSSRTYKALRRGSCGGERDGAANFAHSTSIIHGDAEIVFNRNCQESQMYSSLTAVVLCIVTQAAVAQCVAPVPVAQQTRPAAALINKKTVVTAPATGAARPGGELIKTATAGTQDEVPHISRGAPVAMAGAQEDEQHRHGGTGMLLAALALMSGIALRRFGAHNQ